MEDSFLRIWSDGDDNIQGICCSEMPENFEGDLCHQSRVMRGKNFMGMKASLSACLLAGIRQVSSGICSALTVNKLRTIFNPPGPNFCSKNP